MKMVAHSVLVSFNVPATSLSNPVNAVTLRQEFDAKLSHYGLAAASGENRVPAETGTLVLYTSQDGKHAVLRVYPDGTVTLDLHEFVGKDESRTFTDEVVQELENDLNTSLKTLRSTSLPAIYRGTEFNIYYPTVDNRIVEYDIDRVVFEQQSEYQHVLIVHTASFGNVLVLDGDINLSEADLVYSHNLMQHGKVSYKDKTVLILGGGDGGLLHELLKEGPSMVTMIDIDDVVLKAAKQHLRGICGESLDKLEGENYKVVVGDAIKYLKDTIAEGRTFDYVLYDITAVPVTPEPMGDEWDFLRLSFNMGLKVLAPGGKYLTHATAKLAYKSINMFESELNKLETPVEWKKHEAFVPSFHEIWTFYEVWKTDL